MGFRRFGAVATAVVVVCVVGAGPSTAGDAPSPFTEEALARGLDFTMSGYPQVQGYVGQGCGFVDMDSDGDPDAVVIGGADGRIGIFENVGGGTFVDHTLTSGIPVMTQQEGFASADYDADGFLDLYITQANNRPNYLMKNNGNFTFTDVTASSLTSNGNQTSTGPTWGDYNEDGWPDIYVTNYGQVNALYRNNGNGTFSNLAAALGVSGGTALSFQTVWTDFDRDGEVDLYLSNDRAVLGFPANLLWRNDDGVFFDVSEGSGADVSIYSMGIGAGDIDDNGYTDVYLTNINSFESNGGSVEYDGTNPLLLNQGNGTFVDAAEEWGVENRISSWAAIIFDYDNDTFKDLYVNNQFYPNSFFVCHGPPCTEMANDLGVEAGHDTDFQLPDNPPEIASYSSAIADVDGDGDLDLMVNNLGYRAELFINNEGSNRNWVRYDVVGEYPNLFAIGVGVETTAGGKTQFHERFAGGNGYLGQNELVIHVGLGDAEQVDQAVFVWPSAGPTRTLTHLPAKQQWTIYPPSRLCDSEGDGLDYQDVIDFSGCFVTGFSPGCEMMDFDGDSFVSAGDLEDCYVTAPADCNGNGTEDLAEIMLDLSLDADQDYAIDCCQSGPATEPNQVGDTLLLDKSGADEPELSWTAPASDGSHDPATSYDVFRTAGSPSGDFGFLANVVTTSHTDGDTSPAKAFYLVGARNGCGSSGEEPF